MAYEYTVWLTRTDDEGATLDETSFVVASVVPMSDDARRGIHALADQYTGVRIVVHEAQLLMSSEPGKTIATSAMAEIDRLWPDALRGAVSDPADARMNELERAIKLNERAVLSIASKIDQLAELLILNAQQQPRTASVLAEPVVHHVEPVAPVAPTQQQQLAAGKGFPLVGTPLPITGDPTMPTNPNARGSGRTPEMASGMMATAGPNATSRVLSYSGRVNDKGEAVFDAHELPKVGDSLRRGTQLSDIEVPK